MSKWKPIETAPKDGTHILLYWPQTGDYATFDGYRVEGARWLSEAECVGGRRYWEPHFISIAHEQVHLSAMTHWMPLNPP